MSIASEIERINNNIEAAYEGLEAKGATLPAEQNSANLAAAVGTVPTLSFEVVQNKPTEDIKTNVIYLIPTENSDTENIYDEWIYVNGSWEKIGSTAINIADEIGKDWRSTMQLYYALLTALFLSSNEMSAATIRSSGLAAAMAAVDDLSYDSDFTYQSLATRIQNGLTQRITRIAKTGGDDVKPLDSSTVVRMYYVEAYEYRDGESAPAFITDITPDDLNQLIHDYSHIIFVGIAEEGEDYEMQIRFYLSKAITTSEKYCDVVVLFSPDASVRYEQDMNLSDGNVVFVLDV